MKLNNIFSHHDKQMITFVSISFLIINAIFFLLFSGSGLASILDGTTANSYARYATKTYLKKIGLDGYYNKKFMNEFIVDIQEYCEEETNKKNGVNKLAALMTYTNFLNITKEEKSRYYLEYKTPFIRCFNDKFTNTPIEQKYLDDLSERLKNLHNENDIKTQVEKIKQDNIISYQEYIETLKIADNVRARVDYKKTYSSIQ